MRKDTLNFVLGLLVGTILGIMVRDKDKKTVQEALNDHLKQFRKKYDELSSQGMEMFKEGIDKAKTLKKEYLS